MNEETTTILIDTALASGAASALDPEERKLQELVLAVRDDAPSPDPDFALRMDARVAAGFPRRRRFAMPSFMTKRPQLAMMGAAASLLIALVVAVGIGTNHSGSAPAPDIAASPERSAGSGAAAAPAPAAPAQKAIAPESSASSGTTSSSDAVIGPVPPQPGGDFVGGSNRKVEQSAALVLAPSMDKLDDVGDQVIAVTDRYRGIVMSSSITSADQGGGGSFDLRIPVRNLRSALRDLSALADVQSRTENSSDVTASFVSARTRLQELQAERRGLLRRLEHATTDQASAAIRARLRLVNAQIQSQLSVLSEMRRRTDYAQVSVTLEPKHGSSGAPTGIGKGWHDLRNSLVGAANTALRVLGVALPIGLVLALLWASTGWFSRRRREAALD